MAAPSRDNEVREWFRDRGALRSHRLDADHFPDLPVAKVRRLAREGQDEAVPRNALLELSVPGSDGSVRRVICIDPEQMLSLCAQRSAAFNNAIQGLSRSAGVAHMVIYSDMSTGRNVLNPQRSKEPEHKV